MIGFWQNWFVVLGAVVLRGWGLVGEMMGGVGGVMRMLWLTERRRSRDAVMTESWAERWSLCWEPRHKNRQTYSGETLAAVRIFKLITLCFYILVGLFNKVRYHTH